MADVAKLAMVSSKKRRNTLGAPPSMDEASQNLDAPEVAPAPEAAPAPEREKVVELQRKSLPTTAAARASVERVEPPAAAERPPRIDGRSLRKTDRTVPFASRVTPEFDVRLRQIAERDRLKLVEVLEKALDAYEAHRRT